MSSANLKGAGRDDKGTASGSSKAGSRVTRERKQYDHEMSDQERFALQTVQRAQSALKAVNDAIKSGKPVKAEMVQLCAKIVEATGTMLFT